MSLWRQNAQTSIILGLVVFLLLFIPGLIWQYWRHGQFSFRRMLGWLGVCVYTTALFVYTFMPLPSDRVAWCAEHNVGYNLEPFAFIADIREETAGMSLAQMARSFPVLQVAFNVLLFVPFGAIMRRYFGRGIVLSTLAGAATSIFIEFSQYTGLFGIYPCSIRVADVDDVMTNTLGALLGAILAPALLWWMPSGKALSAKRLAPRPVTAGRRWIGMLLDAVLFGVVQASVSIALRIARWVASGELPQTTTRWEDIASIVAALGLVFVIPALGGRGASAGQKIVWLTPKWLSPDRSMLTDGNVFLRVARSLVVVGPWVASTLLPDEWWWAGIVSLASLLIVLLSLIFVPDSRTHRSLSGMVTGAVFVDSRDPFAGGPENGEVPPLTSAKKQELGI
ncbi:VanZ family protein [Actinomycetaceae bacterium L2_0104]